MRVCQVYKRHWQCWFLYDYYFGANTAYISADFCTDSGTAYISADSRTPNISADLRCTRYQDTEIFDAAAIQDC